MPAEAGRSDRSVLRTGLAVGIGVALLVVLLVHTGFDVLHDQFDKLRWTAPLVLLPYAAIAIVDAFAWRFTLPASVQPQVPFHVLVFARLAGEAVNSVTPTATLGGEPVKAHLLRAYGVSTSDGLASIVLAKTALTIAQSLFTAFGIFGLFLFLGRRELAGLWLAILLVVLAGFTYLLVRVQQRNP